MASLIRMSKGTDTANNGGGSCMEFVSGYWVEGSASHAPAICSDVIN